MLENLLIKVLRFFDLCGFCTEYNVILSKKGHNKLSIILFSFHIINFVVLCNILYPFMANPMERFDAISRFNDCVKFGGLLLNYSGTLIASMRMRSSQRKIWESLLKNQHQTNNFTNSNILRCLKFKSLFYVVMTFSAAIPALPAIWASPREWLLTQAHFWYSFYFLIFIHQTRVFYYSLHLDLLLDEFKLIDQLIDEIKFLLKYPNGCEGEKMEINCEKVKQIRQSYEKIQCFVNRLNNVFGLAHFITVIFCFVEPLCEFNFLYWRIKKDLPIWFPSI